MITYGEQKLTEEHYEYTFNRQYRQVVFLSADEGGSSTYLVKS